MIERLNKGLHDYIYTNVIFKYSPQNTCDSLLDIAAVSGAWLGRFKSISNSDKLGLDLDINQFQLKDVPVKAFNFAH